MNTLGVIMQIVGLAVAAAALIWELIAAKRQPPPPTLPDISRLVKGPDPWHGERVAGMRSIRTPTRYEDPQRGLIRVAAEVAKLVEDDRIRASKAWKRQSDLAVQLYQGNQELLNAYMQQISGAHSVMRTRVLIELGGLALAVVGTVLGASC